MSILIRFACVGLLTVFLGALPHRLASQERSARQKVLEVAAAYAAGDDSAVERWVSNDAHLIALPSAHHAILSEEWSQANAAFLAELAFFVPQTPRKLTLLRALREYVFRRAASSNRGSKEQEFELLLHCFSVAVAQQEQEHEFQLEQLPAIAERVLRLTGRLVPQLSLARAVAITGLCCYTTRGKVLNRTGSGVDPSRFAAALNELAAASAGDLRAESSLRAGVQLFWNGNYQQALERLDRATRSDIDGGWAGLAFLFKARTLEALERDAEAAEAYARSLEYAPSQLAGIGMAAALFRIGSDDEAVKIRDFVLSSDASEDHFDLLERGDPLVLAQMIKRLRAARHAR